MEKKVGVGQLRSCWWKCFDKIKDELMADIKKVKEEQNLHTVALLLTDIMKEKWSTCNKWWHFLSLKSI